MVDFKDADPDDGVGVVPQREIYEWDDKGNVIYYEEWGYDNTTGGLKLENKTSYEYEYDKYGNETKIVVGDLKTVEILNTPGITPHVQEYLWDNNNWKLDSYTVYYPAGSNLESENNESVGEDNKGGFDIILNVPKDSIAGGSFVIDLPEGFVLDQKNTKLTVDFNQFELVITKQPANSWRLEIKAKTKAFLAMQEQSQEGPAVLAHIAYLVDETLKRDKYDITLNNIQFTTPGNSIIPEPEMIVSVQLNRWATSTESIGSQAAKVVCENQVLIIDSPVSESIEIYSVAGFKVYQGIKPVGQVTVNLSHLPGNVIIVKGGNSWVKKIFVR